MIEKIWAYFRGYVKICVRGEQMERFLNLCRSRKISLLNISCRDSIEITAYMTLEDFFKLRPIRNKSKVHICVLEKHGLPFFFYRNKKRRAFFIGIMLGAAVLFAFSKRIWNIHIEGNKKNTTYEIIEYLEQNGIVHGTAKSAINCEEIASLVRRQYQNIAWVSVKIHGTSLILNIKEGIAEKNDLKKEIPCDLSADRKGVIVSMITRQGIPLVHPGDLCEKGEILVSGELPIINDDQEIIRYAYVKADADVIVRYKQPYRNEFLMKYETQTPTGRVKKGFSFFVWKIYLDLFPKKQKSWHCKKEWKPCYLFENYRVPVTLGKTIYEEYETKRLVYTEEQAKKKALQELHLYEEELLKSGAKIIKNNVVINVTDQSCIASGSLTIEEKTGRETPVKIRKETTAQTET